MAVVVGDQVIPPNVPTISLGRAALSLGLIGTTMVAYTQGLNGNARDWWIVGNTSMMGAFSLLQPSIRRVSHVAHSLIFAAAAGGVAGGLLDNEVTALNTSGLVGMMGVFFGNAYLLFRGLP